MKSYNKYFAKLLLVVLPILMLCAITACGTVKTTDSSRIESASNETQTEITAVTSENENQELSERSSAYDTTVPTTEPPSSEPAGRNTSGVLVVYFSHTGTTKKVAEYLHGIVGGDLVELEPVEGYPEGYSAALDPAKEEQQENARPELKTKIENFDAYNIVYLGYPIWWGTAPMLVYTFLESYDFSGKTVVPFATSGGTGISQSVTDIKSEIPDALVTDGLLVNDKGEIIPWLEKLGLYSAN